MINTTELPCYQYRIGGLLIVELPSLPYEQSWTIFRDVDVIGILAGLTEQDRRRVLAEAMAELIGTTGRPGMRIEPTTTLPCPAWCEYEPGHGFEDTAPGGDLVRFHSRDFGDHLAVIVEERATSDEGPATVVHGPYLDVSAEGPFTLEQARQLARGIEAAADFLGGLS